MNIKLNLLGHKLIVWGVILFLIGLIQGVLIPNFHNPRMALSAHLAAVQSGMAMIIFGLIWSLLNLKNLFLKIAYYSNILGMYLVWIGISLSAFFGASRALPIAGQGFSTTSFIESTIEIIIIAGALATLISVSLIVIGLFKGFSVKEFN